MILKFSDTKLIIPGKAKAKPGFKRKGIMRTIYEIENEIDEIVGELDEISRMTEDEAALKFNVDNKDQIIALDKDRLIELSKELHEALEAEESYSPYDPAEEIFGSQLAMEEYLY